MSGFTLNWLFKDTNGSQLTEKLLAREEDWKQEVPTPKYKTPLSEMIQLARQLRLKNMTKGEIYEEVIHKKVKNVIILEETGMCSNGQIKPQNQNEAFTKLASNVNMKKTDDPPLDDDIKTGYKLFHATAYCPTMGIKLFRFVDQLLSNETSRTITLTFVNLFRSGAVREKTSFALAKQFYHALAFTVDLQYGNVLLASSANAQLKALKRNDWPFLPTTLIW